MDDRRKRFLIAKALWEFVAENRNKPIERQAPNDADDMEAILDAPTEKKLQLILFYTFFVYKHYSISRANCRFT